MSALFLEQILFIRKGAETERFHSIRTLQKETVAHHSFGVAWFCWLLAKESPSAPLLMAALTHDLAEHQTGDIPAPTKRQLGIRSQVDDLERTSLGKVGITLPELSPEEGRILALADVFDGMMACQRERAMGNRLIDPIYFNFCSYAEALNPSGVELEIFNSVRQLWRAVL